MYLLISLLLGAIAAISSLNRENKIVSIVVGIVTFLGFWIINWAFMPTINFWGFDGIWIEIFFACLIGFLIGYMEAEEINLVSAIMLGLCIFGFFVRCGATFEIFHTEEYKNLLTVEEVEDSVFVNNIHPVPVDKMINVKKRYAEDLASKRIENMASLGSRCTFGKAHMINLDGTFSFTTAEGQKLTETFDNEKVWVMPLEHKGYWKWKKNKTTEGYCIVSAHNPGRIFFVTEAESDIENYAYVIKGGYETSPEFYFMLRVIKTTGEIITLNVAERFYLNDNFYNRTVKQKSQIPSLLFDGTDC